MSSPPPEPAAGTPGSPAPVAEAGTGGAQGGRDGLEAFIRGMISALEAQQCLRLGAFLQIGRERGLAAVILVPTLLMLMPFGLFPGSNAALGVLMALIALQMLLGAERLRLPRRLRDMRIGGAFMRRALARLLPWAAWLDRHTGRRLQFLAEGALAERAAALVMLGLSLVAVAGGLIPGIPTVVSLVVLLLALGLLLRDGVILAIGYGSTALALWGLWRLFG